MRSIDHASNEISVSDKASTPALPTTLPALPSKTNGPALLVGVMGPSWVKVSIVDDSLASPSSIRGCVGVIGRRY